MQMYQKKIAILHPELFSPLCRFRNHPLYCSKGPHTLLSYNNPFNYYYCLNIDQEIFETLSVQVRTPENANINASFCHFYLIISILKKTFSGTNLKIH